MLDSLNSLVEGLDGVDLAICNHCSVHSKRHAFCKGLEHVNFFHFLLKSLSSIKKQLCGTSLEDVDQVERVSQIFANLEEVFLSLSKFLQVLTSLDCRLAFQHDFLEVFEQELRCLHHDNLVIAFQSERDVVVFDKISNY